MGDIEGYNSYENDINMEGLSPLSIENQERVLNLRDKIKKIKDIVKRDYFSATVIEKVENELDFGKGKQGEILENKGFTKFGLQSSLNDSIVKNAGLLNEKTKTFNKEQLEQYVTEIQKMVFGILNNDIKNAEKIFDNIDLIVNKDSINQMVENVNRAPQEKVQKVRKIINLYGAPLYVIDQGNKQITGEYNNEVNTSTDLQHVGSGKTSDGKIGSLNSIHPAE